MRRALGWFLHSRRNRVVGGVGVAAGLLLLSTSSAFLAAAIDGDRSAPAETPAAGSTPTPGTTPAPAAEAHEHGPSEVTDRAVRQRVEGFLTAWQSRGDGWLERVSEHAADGLRPYLAAANQQAIPSAPVTGMETVELSDFAAAVEATLRDGTVLAVRLGWTGQRWEVTDVAEAA